MGIESLKELVVGGARTAALIEGLRNGFDLSDLKLALAAAKALPPAIRDASQALQEYKDMTDAEAMELDAAIEAEFELQSDTTEKFIENALHFVVSLHDLIGFLPFKAMV